MKCLYYQASTKHIISVDANFVLCHKKAAGTSIRLPLHNGTFFLNQVDVDSYVSAYKGSQSTFISKVSMLYNSIAQNVGGKCLVIIIIHHQNFNPMQ